MTNFRTKLPPIDFPFKIDHHSSSLCIGSCFAEHMGRRLKKYKFPTLINPLGILYNPISIADQLQRVVKEDFYKADELFEHQGLWHHFLFHSQFSGTVKEAVLSEMNLRLKKVNAYIKQADQIIITLGTANVFIDKSSEKIVANCHKLPANKFERALLSISDCTSTLSDLFEQLKNKNPKLNIILTVSPIRHTKDGLIENQRSKSTLLLTCAELEKQYDYIHYFPAWEIMMDDLRDYRFYESDMIHPDKTATDYIWSSFQNGLFSKNTLVLMERIEQVTLASQHRPFQIDSSGHQTFLRKQLEEIDRLLSDFPFLTFEEERGVFKGQIKVD